MVLAKEEREVKESNALLAALAEENNSHQIDAFVDALNGYNEAMSPIVVKKYLEGQNMTPTMPQVIETIKRKNV